MSVYLTNSGKPGVAFRGLIELVTEEDIDLTTNRPSGKTRVRIQIVSGTDEERKQAIAETGANLPNAGSAIKIMRHSVGDYVDVEANLAKCLYECARGFVELAAQVK